MTILAQLPQGEWNENYYKNLVDLAMGSQRYASEPIMLSRDHLAFILVIMNYHSVLGHRKERAVCTLIGVRDGAEAKS